MFLRHFIKILHCRCMILYDESQVLLQWLVSKSLRVEIKYLVRRIHSIKYVSPSARPAERPGENGLRHGTEHLVVIRYLVKQSYSGPGKPDGMRSLVRRETTSSGPRKNGSYICMLRYGRRRAPCQSSYALDELGSPTSCARLRSGRTIPVSASVVSPRRPQGIYCYAALGKRTGGRNQVTA